jgi:hypothetical protein
LRDVAAPLSPSALLPQNPRVNNKQQIEKLRRKYRSEWDACHLIAHRNAELRRTGRQPSNEQLISEQRAVEAVALIVGELRSAMARLGDEQALRPAT